MILRHVDLAQAAKGAYDNRNTVRLARDLEFSCYANIIAVRGSEVDPWDWMRNFLVVPGKCDYGVGLAPLGYALAANRLVEYLKIHAAGYGLDLDRPIYLTGHSAGGAIAILAAEQFASLEWPVIECVTFGTARSGARELQVKNTIYRHGGDRICNVPWIWKHPVPITDLPDVSPGIRQHAMDWYVEAIECI